MKKKKVTKSVEQDAEDGELQEEEANTESFETMESGSPIHLQEQYLLLG